MFGESKKLIIGFIAYGESTSKYLPYFLDSLKKQTYQDFKILVVDNTELKENENKKYINVYYPEIGIDWSGENIGFSRAYNKMIKRASDLGASFFLMINPDIFLEEDAIEKMIDALENNGGLGSVSPKILKWDFENNKKTNIIDTCGIVMNPGLRFTDLNQGNIDNRIETNISILGPSGAAGIYRLDVLNKITEDSKYLDELMFMYKEDCDLAYRLFLNGYKSKCITESVVYHDRTVSSTGNGIISDIKDRRSRSRKTRSWSFLNQQIIFIRYWSLQSLYNKVLIVLFEIKSFIFIILFERFLLGEFITLFKIRKKIKSYKIN